MKSVLLFPCVFPYIFGATTCNLPIDVVFLQDTTASFDDDIPNISLQIAEITAHINGLYPGSQFGVAEFRDKPYFPLGYPDDFCYRLNRGGQLTFNTTTFHDAYELMVASGGADLPEAQFQALIDVALDKQVGWRDLYADESAENPTTAARIVVLVTDAVPHIAGDVAKFTEVQDLPPNSGSISSDDITFECIAQEYPTPEQVAQVLEDQSIQVLILAPTLPTVEPAWRWFSETLLGQDSRYFQITESDSSDFTPALKRAIAAVSEDIKCDMIPSTTEQFSTSASTTLPSTSEVSTTTKDCSKCPCEANELPCNNCDSACEGAVYIRLAKKPQHLQVVVDNE